jgi:diaminopimelate decarboxylase
MATNRLSVGQIELALQRALSTEALIDREEDTSVIFYDLTHIHGRISDIQASFPNNALHAIAVKANPLGGVLRSIGSLGIGLEVASLPELHLALNAGFAPNRIVFDSPAKTVRELEFAMSIGIHINTDSLAELARVESILRVRPSESTIGVRLNPQIGDGAIPSTSAAGAYSKFGIPLGDDHEELLRSFVRHEWLCGVHVHIGSQGCPVDQILHGISKVYDFTRELNDAFRASGQPNRIRVFDIGGGLPVAYSGDRSVTSMSMYGATLRERFPELFGPEYRLITEFGRYVYANAGWVASRVECVKTDKTATTAVIHVGADLLLRECYAPLDWHHDILLFDGAGTRKQVTGSEGRPYTIAGPLCFAGDIVARLVHLPTVEPGDFIVIRDSGAYALSMWSRYNSRQIPMVVGYRDDGIEFRVLKKKESIVDVLRFWN